MVNVFLRIASFSVTRPKSAVLISLCIALFCAFWIQNISFTDDYDIFFKNDNEQLLAHKSIQKTYNQSDGVLFIVSFLEGDAFTADNIAAVTELTARSWQLPSISRVDSLTNFQRVESDGDSLTIGDLGFNTDLQEMKDYALNEPLLVRRLVSRTGDVAGVNAVFERPKLSSDESTIIMLAARELSTQIMLKYPAITIQLTGIVSMDYAFLEVSQSDMEKLVPSMLLLILLVCALLFRSWKVALASFILIMFVVVFCIGMSNLSGILLHAVTAPAPIIVMTIALANCIHLFTGMAVNRMASLDETQALLLSIKENTKPILITNITTLIGFLSMNLSEVPAFHDLGNMISIGILSIIVFSFLLFPALVILLSVKPSLPLNSSRWLVTTMVKIVTQHPKAIIVAHLLLFLLAGFFVTQNELNDEFVKYFDKGVAFRDATEYSTEKLTGIYAIEYSFDQGIAGGVTDPDYLAEMNQFVQWLRDQEQVIHVFSLADLYHRINNAMDGDLQRANQELLAQYLLLYEMSLAEGLGLDELINADKSASKITITLDTLSSTGMLALEAKIHRWISDNMPRHQHDIAASPTLMFAHIGQKNIVSSLQSTAIALLFITLILMLTLRSVKYGMISIIPNVLPAIFAFGVWGLLVSQAGMSLAAVVSISLGIVVDDSIHFLYRYMSAKRQGLNAQQAIVATFTSVGGALWATTLSLTVGFLILSQSSFSVNADMGYMTAMIMVFALMADFFLLPALLLLIDTDVQCPDNETRLEASVQ